jgi:DNA polymerase-3 subunit delta
MTLLKTSDAANFLARPDPARPIALIFGPDAGLVSERCEALIAASVDDVRDPFAVLRIGGDDLATDPAKLVDEAQAIPMFGGRRAIWIRAGARNFIPALELLLAAGVRETRIVIEAGDLKKSAALRAFCERERAVAAIVCYADTERDIERLIDEEMRSANLKVAADASAMLTSLLGGDRRASRNELRKLAAYCQSTGSVSVEDVLAAVSDASALAMDDIVDAAFAGRPADVEMQFSRAVAAGTSPAAVIGAALRHVSQIHKMALDVAQGMPIDAAIGHRIFFRRKPLVEAVLRNWTAPRLLTALQDIAGTARDIRVASGASAALSEALVRATLLRIAVQARMRAAA